MPGFNWKNPAGLDPKVGIPTREWTRHRMGLFKQYCHQSLVNQRCQDFELLLLFDGETTDRRIAAGLNKVTPIFFDPEPKWKYQIYDLVRSRIKPDTDWVLTTRIDSDDAIRDDYVKAMQRLAREFPADRVFYAPLGYVYNVELKRLRQVVRENWYTCFLTRLEPVSKKNIVTCYAPGMHGWKGIDPEEVKANTVLHNRPVWVQVIHGKNIATHTGTDGKRYGAKDVNLSILERFSIKYEGISHSLKPQRRGDASRNAEVSHRRVEGSRRRK
jgi:hypothetical protein